MTVERWEKLIGQLAEIKVIDRRPEAADCFVDLSAGGAGGRGAER
jgi:hypothetical protein